MTTRFRIRLICSLLILSLSCLALGEPAGGNKLRFLDQCAAKFAKVANAFLLRGNIAARAEKPKFAGYAPQSMEEAAGKGKGASPRVGARKPDYNSPTFRNQLLMVMERLDPTEASAPQALLDRSDILAYEEGGMGATFAVRDRETGEKFRYKAPMYLDKQSKALFAREAELAERAGKIGVGPKAELDPATDLLKMEEIEGMNLGNFKVQVLDKMNEPERAAWLANFTVAITEKLQKLHEAGIVHLDIKPLNIMVPTENENGKKIYLIDFGLALNIADLPQVHEAQAGQPYPGTSFYQGMLSFLGKPGVPEDLHQLQVMLRLLTSQRSAPKFAAVLGLLEASVVAEAAEPQNAADYELIKLALKKGLSETESKQFWDLFESRFSKRTPGQKVRLLFSYPELNSEEGFLARLKPEELKTLIDDGIRENAWTFVRDGQNRVTTPTALFEKYFYSGPHAPPKSADVDYGRLVQVREKLGPLSGAAFDQILQQKAQRNSKFVPSAASLQMAAPP